MTSSPRWHPLPVDSSPGTPVLLVSIDIRGASYTINLTDMANIWSETMDRKGICMRGWSENTSIDPSDTPENMAKFLTSIHSALDPSQPGHDSTSLALSPAEPKDAGEDGLTLRVSCHLVGLEPLKWPFHLRKASPSAIATALILPLAQAHYSRNLEVESLVQALAQKDAVLSKLLDKLEAVGVGLDHVFNALSGKKVTRSLAEDKIAGLAPFNQRRWRDHVDAEHSEPASVTHLIHDIFGGCGVPAQTTMKIQSSLELDEWWRDFKTLSHVPIRTQPKVVEEEKRPEPSQDKSERMDEDDDFQVQATPPHLSSKRKHTIGKQPVLPDDASTEDEDDPVVLDSLKTKIAATSEPRPESKTSASRLGAIGKKPTAKPKEPSPPVASRPKDKTQGLGNDSETASEADDDIAAAIPVDSSPPPIPKPAQRKGGLGQIGGRKPAPAPRQKSKTPEPPTERDVTKSSLPTPKKLGVIGKQAGGESNASLADVDRGRQRDRPLEPDITQQKQRETSQERADRKRDELKRELEKKAAAGPAKKKRKF
ncbi:XRCC4-like factor-domain-containing protein [Stachybotrys elegans]|uniref:Non-homologous end-joining factor 1 n=1 Tax=Stachybotrys elegans TaxID=80388 RepID=A0A8K0SNH2_9HYPO|nr:XRCC4-like factor-domain-containing protein [Stachybotrys elegans]